MTYMWKYTDKVYRFQTNERNVQKKLSKEKHAHLVSLGVSEETWIYDFLIDNSKEAWQILENLAGAPVRESNTQGVYVA